MSVSTHVLDAARGLPASDVPVRLEALNGADWRLLATTRTDTDGRARDGLRAMFQAGQYRLVFDTGAYFAARGVKEHFYPQVVICFAIADPAAHHHVPLLLSPFAYSTYRGS